MSKKVKKILLVGFVVGLFVSEIAVCGKIGTIMKENRITTEKKVEHERQTQMKMDAADMVGRSIEKGKQVHAEKLQKELENEAEEHKNDKPVQASKPITSEEKEDLNKG